MSKIINFLVMVMGGLFISSAGCSTKGYGEKYTKGEVIKESYDTPPEGS